MQIFFMKGAKVLGARAQAQCPKFRGAPTTEFKCNYYSLPKLKCLIKFKIDIIKFTIVNYIYYHY